MINEGIDLDGFNLNFGEDLSLSLDMIQDLAFFSNVDEEPISFIKNPHYMEFVSDARKDSNGDDLETTSESNITSSSSKYVFSFSEMQCC